MRRVLCFLGFHDPKIKRRVLWGDIYRAELFCRCGRRFEGLAFNSDTSNLGFVRAEAHPTDWWQMYDGGTLPLTVARNGTVYGVPAPVLLELATDEFLVSQSLGGAAAENTTVKPVENRPETGGSQ